MERKKYEKSFDSIQTLEIYLQTLNLNFSRFIRVKYELIKFIRDETMVYVYIH